MSTAGAPSTESFGNALPPGTRLGEFELKRVIGVGGFGIVYLAFDHGLEREVAIKEYMPSSLASRTATMHVSLTSPSNAETFALGLRSFVNEARLLARFDHPSLIKVHRFWEDHSTAYMVMPLYRGRTLRDVRMAMNAAPDEAWLRALLEPLLGALEVLHREAVFHRDIAPDNIVIGDDGVPMLLDFGAARHVISDRSQTLTAILKPSYAPIEQYGESGSLRQGAWTDLYALGATLHFLVTQAPPAPATVRMVHDDAAPLAERAGASIGVSFLQLVDWMLAPRPADRPQSVADVRAALGGQRRIPTRAAARPSDWERTAILPAEPAPQREPAPEAGFDMDATLVQPRQAAPSTPTGRSVPPVPTVAQPRAPTPAPITKTVRVEPPASARPEATPKGAGAPGAPRSLVPSAMPASSAGSSSARWVGGIAAVLLLGAGAFWGLNRGSAPPPPAAAASAVVADPTSPAASANLPLPASTGAGVASPASAPPVVAGAASVPTVVSVSVPVAVPVATVASSALPPPTGAGSMPSVRATAPSMATPVPPATALPRQQTTAMPTRPAASRPVAVADRKPLPGPGAEAAPGVLAKPPPVLATEPLPAARPLNPRDVASQPAAAIASRPVVPAPDLQRNPREQCGGRVFLALHSCLLRECPKPQYRNHPECVRVREIEERAGRTMP